MKSKVGKEVDHKIIVLELMKEYGQPYEYFTEVISEDLFEIMKKKLHLEREQKRKNNL